MVADLAKPWSATPTTTLAEDPFSMLPYQKKTEKEEEKKTNASIRKTARRATTVSHFVCNFFVRSLGKFYKKIPNHCVIFHLAQLQNSPHQKYCSFFFFYGAGGRAYNFWKTCYRKYYDIHAFHFKVNIELFMKNVKQIKYKKETYKQLDDFEITTS